MTRRFEGVVVVAVAIAMVAAYLGIATVAGYLWDLDPTQKRVIVSAVTECPPSDAQIQIQLMPEGYRVFFPDAVLFQRYGEPVSHGEYGQILLLLPDEGNGGSR